MWGHIPRGPPRIADWTRRSSNRLAGGRGITRVVRPSLGRVGQRGAGVGRADAAEQPVRRRPVVVGEVDSQGSFDRVDGVVQGPGSLNRSGTWSEVERTS